MPWPDEYGAGFGAINDRLDALQLGQASAAPQPLPVGGFRSARDWAPHQKSPQSPGKPKPKWQEIAPLLALIPIAMAKGGQAGVGQLLQGYQRGQLLREQQARQGMLDERQFALDERQEQRFQTQEARLTAAQEAQERARQEQLRQGVYRDFLGALNDPALTEEGARALLTLIEPSAAAAGVAMPRLEQAMLTSMTPQRVIRQRVERALKNADPELLLEMYRAGSPLKDGERSIPIEEWGPFVVMGEDREGNPILRGNFPSARQSPAPPSLEQQLLVAMRTGDAAEERRIRSAMNARDINMGGGGQTARPTMEERLLDALRRGDKAEEERIKAAMNARKPQPSTEPTPYSQERGQRTLASVSELLQKVSPWTTGFGSLTAIVPTTPARNFAAELDTLKATIAFNELTAMREASKSGGALGNVSNVELGLLQSALGALDPGQSPANIKTQLEKVFKSVTRWQAAAGLRAPVIFARDPAGNLHSADAGTPLLRGWRLEP